MVEAKTGKMQTFTGCMRIVSIFSTIFLAPSFNGWPAVQFHDGSLSSFN